MPKSTCLTRSAIRVDEDTGLLQTATTHFKSLNSIPLSFILSSSRTQFRHTSNIFLSILILLSGDIQSNPGPISTHSRLNMRTLNIRSLTNPLHFTALADLAESNNIHIFALTETWINPNTTSAQLFDSIPHGFTLFSNPRPVSSSCSSSVVGGGTAFLIRESITLISSADTTFESFEMSTVTLKLPHSKTIALQHLSSSFFICKILRYCIIFTVSWWLSNSYLFHIYFSTRLSHCRRF